MLVLSAFLPPSFGCSSHGVSGSCSCSGRGSSVTRVAAVLSQVLRDNRWGGPSCLASAWAFAPRLPGLRPPVSPAFTTPVSPGLRPHCLPTISVDLRPRPPSQRAFTPTVSLGLRPPLPAPFSLGLQSPSPGPSAVVLIVHCFSVASFNTLYYWLYKFKALKDGEFK